MNKKKAIVIIFVLVLILIISVVAFIFKKPSETINTESGDSMTLDVRILNRNVVYQNAERNVNVTIPEFQNLEDAFERYINQRISEDLSEENVYEEATEGYAEDEIGFFTYEVDYERYDCGDYISIVASQYIHLGDGRPQLRKRCYVINGRENASVSLMDLFADKINYKSRILEEINKQAGEQNIELVGGNGLNEILDTQAFYIKDNQLVIYFESSEIAATAVGELEFVMPFEMTDGMFTL